MKESWGDRGFPSLFFFFFKWLIFLTITQMWKRKAQLLAVEFFEEHGQKLPSSLLTLPKLQ